MDSMKINFHEKYRLRQVADMYWLINIRQPGVPYEKPVALNEAGALICRKLEAGADMEEVAEALSAAYGISRGEARADAEQFMEQLQGCDHTQEQDL